MNNNRQSASAHRGSTTSAHPFNWEKMAILYARTALGIGFLSGIAGRFGLWRGRNVGYGNFVVFNMHTLILNESSMSRNQHNANHAGNRAPTSR